jgi:DNA-directed RNA polymerase alpha subunit
MPQIIHMETKRISARTYYGRFCVEPLPIGQGVTLGNALRRVLLADLVGIAPTSANIVGAVHEFSTLPGIRESVLEILLNIKQIVFKQISLRPKDPELALMRANLNVDGPGRVTAKDLIVPEWIKVVDPSQYIATLASRANLTLEIQLSKGTGYRTKRKGLIPPGFSVAVAKELSETETSDKLDTPLKATSTLPSQSQPIDLQPISAEVDQSSQDQAIPPTDLLAPSKTHQHMTLHIDALFFPVMRVNYRVEELVIDGRRKEELILEIWTNGSLSPRQALHQAVVNMMLMFASIQARPRKLPEPLQKSSPTGGGLSKEIASVTIESLDLSVRSFNCLKRANINTVGKLISYSRHDLLQLKNFGTKSANEVVEILKKRFQLALKGEELPTQVHVSMEDKVTNKSTEQAIEQKKLRRKDKSLSQDQLISEETRKSPKSIKSRRKATTVPTGSEVINLQPDVEKPMKRRRTTKKLLTDTRAESED